MPKKLFNDDMYSEADARVAAQRAEEIEKLKNQKRLERELKTQEKVRKKRAEFRAKFVAPIILIITVVISYLLYTK